MQPMTDTKSGDNDALKHLLATLHYDERSTRVAHPPQCAINSYLWRPSARQWLRVITGHGKISASLWRPGHLLVHFAGWQPTQARPRCALRCWLLLSLLLCLLDATVVATQIATVVSAHA